MQFTDEQLIQRRAGFHDRNYRKGVDINKQENPGRLWWHFRMHIRNITSRYIHTSNPMGVFEIDLHEAWDLFIEAAKVTVDDAAADQLVAQIVVARQLGQISRLNPPAVPNYPDTVKAPAHTARVEDAITSSNERMWTDLPFFITDLQAFWTSSITTMDKAERTNLARVCGRLSASGVGDTNVTCCVLILFRESLETPRRLVMEEDDVDKSHSTLSDYLPAVQAWLSNGSYQILGLCMRNYLPSQGGDHLQSGEGTDSLDWRASGELVPEPVSGFDMSRWRFWIDRLRTIEQDTSDDIVRKQSGTCANIMNRWEEITGGFGTNEERERTHRAHFLKTAQVTGICEANEE